MKFRLSLAYVAVFAIIGVNQPFWPVWLQAQGLDAMAIGILTALTYALKVVATPLAARVAERTGRKRMVVLLLSLGMALSFATFWLTSGFAAILVATLFAYSFWSPLMALIDSNTTILAKQHNFDYGRIRVWGSVAMLVTVASTGALIGKFGPNMVIAGLVAAAVLMVIAALAQPADVVQPIRKSQGGLAPFMASQWFPLFIIATLFVQGSHGAFYAFGSIIWKANGIDESLIGLLWAGSVTAEIIFFANARPLIQRFGPVNMLLVGGIATTLRWMIMAALPGHLGAACAAQLLHVLTFGGSHLAAMAMIGKLVDDRISPTAQALYSAVVMGIGMGAFVFASAPLYDLLGANVFYVTAGLAALGTVLMTALTKDRLVRIAPADTPAEPGIVQPMDRANPA
jgi:PPP family 3-phenylpropionic acid transporter